MKNKYFPPIFFIFCVSAFAAQSETELYYSNSGGGFVLSDAAIWRVGSFDGPQFSGSLTETEDNVNSLNFSAAGSGNDWYVCTLNDSISVAGINADISCAGGGNSYVIDVSAGKTLDVSGDFSVVANYDSFDRVTDLKIRDGASVNIGGDLSYEYNYSGTVSWNTAIFKLGSGGSFYLAGDLKISGGNSQRLILDVKNFTVGGVVGVGNFDSTVSVFSLEGLNVSSDVLYRKMGGLNGGGKMVVNSSGKTVQMEFTNSSACQWSGMLGKGAGDNTSALYITMDAADAENGKQTLRFTGAGDFTTEGGTAYQKMDIASVIVKNGELSLGMPSGMGAGSLSVEGDGAVFSAAGLSGEVGRAYFDSVWFSRGTIRIDFSEADGCDTLVVAEEFYLPNGTGSAFFELNVSSYDLGAWLEASDAQYMDFTILEFGSTNIASKSVAEMLKLSEGVKAEVVEGDFADGKLSLRLSLAQVPEPAAAAALAGALSLVFAAGFTGRRRCR